jgi:hypothetical protein
VPGAAFVSLRRTDVPLPPLPRAAHVQLANGDRLVLDPVGPLRLEGDSLECGVPWRANGGRTLSLPTSRVAVVWLSTPKGPDTAEAWLRRLGAEKRRQDVVLMTDGDRVGGRVKSLDRSGGLRVEANGREVKVPFSRVAAVAFDPGLLLRGKPKGRYGHLVLTDSGRLSVSAATLAVGATTLLVKTPLGDALEIPLRDAAALDLRQGAATYLSDLTPLAYQHTPYLGVSWPYARDASVSGRPMVLAGSTYDKGLGMHAASRLTYDLGGKYRRFEAWVGLDGQAGVSGRAVVRVVIDGKPSEIGGKEITGRGLPLPVRLDVRGAKELTLVVEFARSGDVRAHVDWADARLIE